MKTCRVVCILASVCLLAAGSLYGQTGPGHPHIVPQPQHGQRVYTVQRGDSLADILRSFCGLTDDVIFSDRTKTLLQLANPRLVNVNAVRAGQQLIIPEQLVQRQTDTTGAAGGTAHETQGRKPFSQHPAVGPAAALPSPEKPNVSTSGDEPLREADLAAADVQERKKKSRCMLATLVTALGGRENDTCRHTVSLEDAESFTLDCADFPLYELPWGARLMLDYGRRLPSSLQDVIASTWQQTLLIPVDEGASPVSVIDAAIEGSGLHMLEPGNRYTINRDASRIVATGDRIVFKPSELNAIYIISLQDNPSLPPPLHRYLAGQGVKFIFLGGCDRAARETFAEPAEAAAFDNLTDAGALTDALLDLSGIAFRRNVKARLTSRHETGITIEMTFDRKVLLRRKPCFVSFKPVSENMLELFQEQGFRIFTIDKAKRLSSDTLRSFLAFLGFKNLRSMFCLQYDLSPTNAINICVPGVFLQSGKGDILLTNIMPDNEIIKFLNMNNIRILFF